MRPMTPLKRAIKEQGLRQNQLADLIGLHESQVSRIVNGLHCDDATQKKIACALGLPQADLFPTSEPEDLAA